MMKSALDMNKRDKEASDRLDFVTYIIPKFADEFKMDKQEAYRYLKKYGALDYVFEHWWTFHVDNPFWSVRDLHNYCQQNGGLR